jgi:hypothetical protein
MVIGEGAYPRVGGQAEPAAGGQGVSLDRGVGTSEPSDTRDAPGGAGQPGQDVTGGGDRAAPAGEWPVRSGRPAASARRSTCGRGGRRTRRVREGQPGDHGSDLQGAPFGAAVAPLTGVAGDRDLEPGQLGELGVQAGLVAFDHEGDRLRHVRAVLPCEVLVTAAAHPLRGRGLRAYAFRHVDGVLHLKVGLPEGRSGLVRADATDVHADGEERPGLVLDVAGLRELRGPGPSAARRRGRIGPSGQGRPVSIVG